MSNVNNDSMSDLRRRSFSESTWKSLMSERGKKSPNDKRFMINGVQLNANFLVMKTRTQINDSHRFVITLRVNKRIETKSRENK